MPVLGRTIPQQWQVPGNDIVYFPDILQGKPWQSVTCFLMTFTRNGQ